MTTTNQTNGALKRYFYSGIGFAAHSKDIMQKSVDEFVKHGKVSEAEGKQIIDSAIHRLESGYNEAVHKLAALSNMEISRLKTRIEKMEKTLAVKTSTSGVSSMSVTKRPVRTSLANKKAKAKKASR